MPYTCLPIVGNKILIELCSHPIYTISLFPKPPMIFELSFVIFPENIFIDLDKRLANISFTLKSEFGIMIISLSSVLLRILNLPGYVIDISIGQKR